MARDQRVTDFLAVLTDHERAAWQQRVHELTTLGLPIQTAEGMATDEGLHCGEVAAMLGQTPAKRNSDDDVDS